MRIRARGGDQNVDFHARVFCGLRDGHVEIIVDLALGFDAAGLPARGAEGAEDDARSRANRRNGG